MGIKHNESCLCDICVLERIRKKRLEYDREIEYRDYLKKVNKNNV